MTMPIWTAQQQKKKEQKIKIDLITSFFSVQVNFNKTKEKSVQCTIIKSDV